MEPTTEHPHGVRAIPGGVPADGTNQKRDAESGVGIRWERPTQQDERWGTRRYDGFTSEPITTSNIAYIVQLAEELHGLGTLSNVPFDWAHCMRTMRRVSANPMYFTRLAHNGSFCGAIVGHVDIFFFSPRMLATENAWFVREGTPFRAKIAMALMREFIDWAMNDRGADHVQCGDIANINTMAVDALYRRIGFKRYGAIYRYGGV